MAISCLQHSCKHAGCGGPCGELERASRWAKPAVDLAARETAALSGKAAVAQVLADRPRCAVEQARVAVRRRRERVCVATNAVATPESLPRSLCRPGRFVAGDREGDTASRESAAPSDSVATRALASPRRSGNRIRVYEERTRDRRRPESYRCGGACLLDSYKPCMSLSGVLDSRTDQKKSGGPPVRSLLWLGREAGWAVLWVTVTRRRGRRRRRGRGRGRGRRGQTLRGGWRARRSFRGARRTRMCRGEGLRGGGRASA